MANLEQWVSDNLHDILGLSDKYVSQFMIGSARKASSHQDFVARLQQTNTIDINERVIAFAKELYDKVVFASFFLHLLQKRLTWLIIVLNDFH